LLKVSLLLLLLLLLLLPHCGRLDARREWLRLLLSQGLLLRRLRRVSLSWGLHVGVLLLLRLLLRLLGCCLLLRCVSSLLLLL